MKFGPDRIGVEELYWYRTIPIPFDKPVMLTEQEVAVQRGIKLDQHIFVRKFNLSNEDELLMYERVLNRLKQPNATALFAEVQFSPEIGWTACVIWSESFYRVVDQSIVDKRVVAENLRK